MSEKSHTPTTGENSSSNRNSSTTKSSPIKNSSPNNKHCGMDAFSRYCRNRVARLSKLAGSNLTNIFRGFMLGSLVIAMAHGDYMAKLYIVLSIALYALISVGEGMGEFQRLSTMEKFAKFKRFTHLKPSGAVTIKNEEIEQIILYLYEIEEYLGKEDPERIGDGGHASVRKPDAGGGQERTGSRD